jgi:hypothetical protein
MIRRLVPTAGALFCIATAAVAAAELPTRKAGLWDVRMVFEGRSLPPRTMQQCVDAQSDKLMNSNVGGGNPAEKCSKRDIQRSAGKLTMDSVCKFGDATTTSHAVVTGSFDSAYTMHVTSTRAGGRPMPGTKPGQATEMTIEAKWLGPCKPGQKPGDVMMPNGMKMNVLDHSMSGMPGLPGRKPPR